MIKSVYIDKRTPKVSFQIFKTNKSNVYFCFHLDGGWVWLDTVDIFLE